MDTHSAFHMVTYDITDASPILSGLERFRMTRIYNTYRLGFDSAETRNDYIRGRDLWRLRNKLDVHYDFSERDTFPGLRSHLLTFNDDRSKFPIFLNCGCLLLLSFVMFDWLLIFWFMRNSARLNYEYVKVATRVKC